MRVIDQKQEWASFGVRDQLAHVVAEQVPLGPGPDGGQAGREEGGKGAEGIGARLLGARHESHRHALVLCELGARPGQRGLAAAGGAHDHGAAARADCFLQKLQLASTTGKRPGTRDDAWRNGCPAHIESHPQIPLEKSRDLFSLNCFRITIGHTQVAGGFFRPFFPFLATNVQHHPVFAQLNTPTTFRCARDTAPRAAAVRKT
jgi:hypothetical protein